MTFGKDKNFGTGESRSTVLISVCLVGFSVSMAIPFLRPPTEKVIERVVTEECPIPEPMICNDFSSGILSVKPELPLIGQLWDVEGIGTVQILEADSETVAYSRKDSNGIWKGANKDTSSRTDFLRWSTVSKEQVVHVAPAVPPVQGQLWKIEAYGVVEVVKVENSVITFSDRKTTRTATMTQWQKFATLASGWTADSAWNQEKNSCSNLLKEAKQEIEVLQQRVKSLREEPQPD